MVTKREKLLIIALLFAIMMIPLMCILVRRLSGTPPENVCLTKECLQTAVQILENLDTSVNPCDDFYQFACGNFIKNQVLPDDRSQLNTFVTLTDRVLHRVRKILEEPIRSDEPNFAKYIKTHYKTCLNETQDNTEKMLSLIEDVGGWPLLKGTKWAEQNFEWHTLDDKLVKKGMITSALLLIEVDTMLTNSSQRILQINEPKIFIKDFLKSGSDNKISDAYKNLIIEVGMMLGANIDIARRDANDVISFFYNISEIAIPLEQTKLSNDMVNVITVEELASNYPAIPWVTYLNNQLLGTVSITKNTLINVAYPKHLRKLMSLVSRTSNRVLANYLVWSAIESSLPQISKKFAKKIEAFYQIIKGTPTPDPSWQQCTEYISENWDWATSALYVRRHFSNKAKEDVEQMVTSIKEQFKNILKQVDWLDANSKKLALEKADSMISFVGYPEELLDNSKLDEYYNLTINLENFLTSDLELNIFLAKKEYKTLNEIHNKTDWTLQQSPIEVNAFYEPTSNSIQLSVGILQDAFFYDNRPKYLNYGGIGFIIGHEITHGFDDEGSEFDKDGNLVKWWSTESEEAFENKAKCIVEQYSNLTVAEVNMTVNGAASEGENIADNGGAKEAYLSYKKWTLGKPEEQYLPGLKRYSNFQMFWIAAATPWCTKIRDEALRYQLLADAHAPSNFRVNIPFANTEYFARDFKCPSGSRMNPKQKCAVW